MVGAVRQSCRSPLRERKRPPRDDIKTLSTSKSDDGVSGVANGAGGVANGTSSKMSNGASGSGKAHHGKSGGSKMYSLQNGAAGSSAGSSRLFSLSGSAKKVMATLSSPLGGASLTLPRQKALHTGARSVSTPALHPGELEPVAGDLR